MDIKVDGLSMDIMRQALDQAKKGRMHILDAMYQCIPEHNADVKPQAPRMEKLIIDSEFIGAVIGPGGKIIQEIQKTTGATINITEVGKTGEVSIFSANKESLDQAVAWVNSIVAQPEVGDIYEGTVKGIKEFGAFIEFLPGKQGLLHISEIMWKRLESMDNVFQEGDKVKVKLVGIDPKSGKFKLSRKVLLPKPEPNQAPHQRHDNN
jgi:polyribonucleotide nucleotidyltransferase